MNRPIAIAVCCALLFAVPARADEKPYVIGLEPTLAESIALPEGRILAKYLSTALGHPVESRVFPTYDDLVNALAAGDVDFAWINPYAFVQATQKGNVVPYARTLRQGEYYRSVFFVRTDSKVRKLSELKGLKVAWVNRSSTAGYLFPRLALRKENLDPDTLFASESFAGSHKGVCDAVLSGAADVGATLHTGNDPGNFRPDGCLASLGAKAGDQLVGIASSDPIPNEVIAGSPNIAKDLAAKLPDVFIHMSENDTGRQVLRAVFHADGFTAAANADFDAVRAYAKLVPTAAPAPAAPEAAQERPYVLGLKPTLSQTLSVPEGRILARYLTTEMKHPVESRPFTSYEALTDALAKGEVDFAWINPLAFVQATRKIDVTPIVKAIRHGESYRSVFFVKAGSSVKSLADLKGLKVAWVDQSSTAGYLFPQATLIKQGLDPATLFANQTFAGSHKAVCEAVLSGEADVGATFHTGTAANDFRPDGCLVSLSSQVADKVQGIASSDPIPNEVIAGSPILSKDLAQKVNTVFVNMSDSEAGRQVLNAVFHADGFGVATNSDFDPVREAIKIVEGPRPPAAAPAVATAPPAASAGTEPTTLRFGTNQVDVGDTSVLAPIVDALKANRKLWLKIEGHTDGVGSAAFNVNLSQRRANAVRAYFVKAGIAATRIAVKGLGMTKPIASNDTDDGRAANRRVEIKVVEAKSSSAKRPAKTVMAK